MSTRLISKNLNIKIYKTIILPVVLYDCEIWFFTLKEECRVRLLGKTILRRIFGSKRDENGRWRRLHNEELNSLYRSPNVMRVIKFRRLRWTGHSARMKEDRIAFEILTDKPTGKRSPGRPRRRWDDNIRIYI